MVIPQQFMEESCNTAFFMYRQKHGGEGGDEEALYSKFGGHGCNARFAHYIATCPNQYSNLKLCRNIVGTP